MKVFAIGVLACLFVSPAFAYDCQGGVGEVALNPDGVLTVWSSGGGLNWAYVCNVNVASNGVAPDTCKSIYAMLLSAQIAGKQVRWSYSDSLSCSTRPSWTWHTGWYYGPVIIN